MEKEDKKKIKTITEVRESFRSDCLRCAENFIELNKSIVKINSLMNSLALEVDEILGFMETSIKLKEEVGFTKEEIKEELEVPEPKDE